MKKNFFVVCLCLFFLIACSSGSGSSINYVQAKEKIINEQAILVDVRTVDEYNEGHIAGAVVLPLDEIDSDSAKDKIGDKNQVIIVYCRSGKRSAEALKKLNSLGYQKVFDLGAMSNWKE